MEHKRLKDVEILNLSHRMTLLVWGKKGHFSCAHICYESSSALWNCNYGIVTVVRGKPKSLIESVYFIVSSDFEKQYSSW